MPFKKTYHRKWKKNNYRKKKYVGRALKQYSVPKNKQTHYHVRRIGTLSEGDFSIDVNTNDSQYYRGLSFRLNDLEGYTELTRLYDRYVITKVVLEWIWTITTPSGAGASGPNASLTPYINVVRDYDDNVIPDATYFRESGRNIRRRLVPNRRVRIALTPAISQPIYKTGLTFGYGPKWKASVDCANPDIPHFGLKIQVNKPPIALGYIQCTAKYYVSMFQTR